eukprot:271734_1
MTWCQYCLIPLLLHVVVSNDSDESDLTKIRADGLLSATHSLSVCIKINEAHDTIELDLLGPSDAYYAIGFGSNMMVNTWSIIVTGDGDDGWFEQTLSNHKAGVPHHSKSFEMLTSSLSAQSYLRRVHLTRPLASVEPYHPFSLNDESIDLIWAVGNDPTFTQHVNHGTMSLVYERDGVTDTKSHGIWIYFGDLSLSALILVVGMGCLFLVMVFYWSWKCCQYLKQRAQEREMAHEEDTVPLLQNIDSNNRYIII